MTTLPNTSVKSGNGDQPRPSKMDNMLDEDTARVVVLGEASMLTTAVLKIHHAHHSYYHGGRSTGSGLKASASMPSRLAAAAASENEEDEDDFLDSTFGVGGDNVGSNSPIDPILKNLIRLKGKLRKGSRSSYSVLTDPTYLRPFCEIIKNKDTSGPITGMALQSILKFIDYGLVSETEMLGSVVAIADSVTKARFVGTDTSSDEVVLLRILNVLKELIVRGYLTLTNELVCEIMQSCFRIAFEPRLSELLRKNAEQALVDMCRSLFSRINHFSNDMPLSMVSYSKMSGSAKISSSSKKLQRAQSEKQPETAPSVSPSTDTCASSVLVNSQGVKFSENAPVPAPILAPTVEPVPRKTTPPEPHGIACIYDLLFYLTSLTNPYESQNTEAMINVGMNLLIVAFENAVHGIGKKPSLMSIVKNDLCWNIVQLLQSDRPLPAFAAALRLAFVIFTSLRHHLKYQMEALFVRMMDIVTTGNAPLEYRETSLEYLVGFFRHIVYLPHELFFNYDCDTSASNLLEGMLQLFSKNCFSTTAANNPQLVGNMNTTFFTPIQLLSLDALLANLKSLQKSELCKESALFLYSSNGRVRSQPPASSKKKQRKSSLPPSHHVDVGRASAADTDHVVVQISEDDSDTQSQSELTVSGEYEGTSSMVKYPKTAVEIEQMKQKKRLLWQACEQFNAKPAKGITYLQEHGLCANDHDIATFIHENSRLDKKLIGEYLSNRKNQTVLSAYVEAFPFNGLRIDEALRMYLESFRLPGEAPLIFLLLEQFAHYWREANSCPFANEDAAFSLAYAIIMLNVDQHNSNVKRQTTPMTSEDFKSNLRQLNGGQDFDPQLLKDIYHTIKNNEIVMPAEQHGIVRERYLWKCLLRRAESESGVYWCADERTASDTAIHQHQQLFISGSVTTSNAGVVETSAEGHDERLKLFLLNGQIFAVLWGPTVAAMTFIFDKINVNHHSSLTRRILNNGFNSCALLCATYGHLDNLIVNLCKFTVNSAGGPTSPLLSSKSQKAAECLFAITRDYANEMRTSWTNIVEMILNWFKAKFLDDTLEIEDFALGDQKIKLRRKVSLKPSQKQSNESSNFLSSFYSYFSGGQPDQQLPEGAEGGDGNSSDKSNMQPSPTINETWQLINSFQPLAIIEESKFLHIDSLVELIKALVNVALELEDEEGDDIEAFKLEMLLQIILLNR